MAARGSEAIRVRYLASVGVTRALTLVVSGIPTVLAWAIMSKRLNAVDFAGVSLALSLPNFSSFILPAMGARIANSVAVGRDAFEDAVARSVRTCLVAGGVLVAVTASLALVGWSRLLGRPHPDPFPMNFAVVFVSCCIALWIVLLIGERILIARGEVTQRVLANAVTGPAALAGVLVVGAVHGPAWAYVLPVPCAMLLAAACSLTLALRSPDVTWRALTTLTHRSTSSTYRRSSLTLWLMVVEASILLPIWLVRPIVSVRGTDADVASLSVALQFATPVFSLLSVIGQGLWPFYARHRESLRLRSVLRHIAIMASVAAVLAAGYAVGLGLLFHWGLVGHSAGVGVIAVMAAYIVVRGAWEPPRIVFSTDATARRLAALAVVVSVLAACSMWLLGGVAHGALVVATVTAAFAILSLGSPLLLIHRLRGPGQVPRQTGDGISTPAP